MKMKSIIQDFWADMSKLSIGLFEDLSGPVTLIQRVAQLGFVCLVLLLHKISGERLLDMSEGEDSPN
jgi:hypothetical protein